MEPVLLRSKEDFFVEDNVVKTFYNRPPLGFDLPQRTHNMYSSREVLVMGLRVLLRHYNKDWAYYGMAYFRPVWPSVAIHLYRLRTIPSGAWRRCCDLQSGPTRTYLPFSRYMAIAMLFSQQNMSRRNSLARKIEVYISRKCVPDTSSVWCEEEPIQTQLVKVSLTGHLTVHLNTSTLVYTDETSYAADKNTVASYPF